MTQKTRNNLLIAITGVGIIVSITIQRNYSQKQMMANFAPLSVIGQGKPVLLELGGEGCPACGKMLPILSEMAKDYAGHFTVAYHDVWKDQSIADQYGVSAIPTLIFFDKDGNEKYRHEGYLPKAEILAAWKAIGLTLPE